MQRLGLFVNGFKFGLQSGVQFGEFLVQAGTAATGSLKLTESFLITRVARRAKLSVKSPCADREAQPAV